MQIPDHLQKTFKLLEAHGQLLSLRYGEGFRRYIKYDDAEKSFYLEVQLPDSNKWVDIPPEEAQAAQNLQTERLRKDMRASMTRPPPEKPKTRLRARGLFQEQERNRNNMETTPSREETAGRGEPEKNWTPGPRPTKTQKKK